MRECDDGFVVGDGSLWVHVMSVEYRNAIDKVAYTLFCMNCPGFVCLSRVRFGTDTRSKMKSISFVHGSPSRERPRAMQSCMKLLRHLIK